MLKNGTTIRINTKTIHLYFIAILIMISSGSLIGYLMNSTFLEIMLIIAALPAIIRTILKCGIRSAFFISFIALYFLLQWFNYPSMSIYLLRFLILIIVLAFLLTDCKRHNINFLKIFYRVICIYAAYTLVFWVLTSFFGFTLGRTVYPRSAYNLDAYSYFYIFFTHTQKAVVPFGISLYRNYGIFSEPGLNSVFLSFALFYNMFVEKERNKQTGRMLVLLLISVISTFSTTGLICAVLFIAVKMYMKQSTGKYRKLVVFVTPVLLAAAVFAIQYLLVDKMATHERSFSNRLYDLIDGWNLFLSKPLLGYGFGNSDVYFNYMIEMGREWTHIHTSNSNGLITILFTQGIIGAILLFLPLAYTLKEKNNKSANISFVFWAVFCMMSQPIVVTTMGAFILGYGYSYSIVKNINKHMEIKQNE